LSEGLSENGGGSYFMAIFHSVYTGGAPFFGIWQKPHSACPKKEDSGMDLGTAQELYIYNIV
jgi:hypothetical protein